MAPKRSLLATKMDCRVISAFTRVFNALCPAMTCHGWDQRNRFVGLFHAVTIERTAAERFFYGKRGTPREVAHWCWRNELYDPLSSFVLELEPRRRRGFSFGSGPERRKPRPWSESAPSPSGAGYRGRWRRARPRSSRVAGIDVGRSFLFALFRHHRGARAALLAAPAQTLLRDVVLARPAIFPSLTYEGLLANGLNHSLRPL